MSTNTKIYKPGQFVWVNGKKCRVTKGGLGICWQCPFDTYKGCPVNEWCIQRLPRNCYPKPIE